MRVNIYVRKIFWKTIEVPDNYTQLDLQLKDSSPFAENDEAFHNTFCGIRCHIQRTNESDPYLTSPEDNPMFYRYVINIESDDIVIWDHDSLKRIGNKKKQYESESFSGEVDSRFEILDL